MAQYDDLEQALRIFQSGTEDLTKFRAINQANEAVQKIRAEEGNEQAKRAQLQEIANQLTAQLAKGGTPATTIQALQGAFGPAQVDTVGKALQAKSVAGSQEAQDFYQQQAENVDITGVTGERVKAREQNEFNAEEKAKDRALMRELAGLKAEKSGKLTASEVRSITDIDNELEKGNQIWEMYKNNPTLVGILEGRIPLRGKAQGEFAAFKAKLGRWSDAYRHRVTGAGAPLKELDMLLTRLPQVGNSRREFEAIIQDVLKEGVVHRRTTVKNLGEAGRSVDKITEPGHYNSIALGLTDITVKDSKGNRVKAQRDAQGNIYIDGQKRGKVK